MLEHHRRGPNLAYRVGYSLARDIRRGAVDRLEHRRKRSLRIDIGRRGYCYRTGNLRSEVRKNVAEEIAADDDAEAFGRHDEARRQYIDVILVRTDFRIFGSDFGEALVPERHRIENPVGFRRGSHVVATEPAGEFEGVAD